MGPLPAPVAVPTPLPTFLDVQYGLDDNFDEAA